MDVHEARSVVEVNAVVELVLQFGRQLIAMLKVSDMGAVKTLLRLCYTSWGLSSRSGSISKPLCLSFRCRDARRG